MGKSLGKRSLQPRHWGQLAVACQASAQGRLGTPDDCWWHWPALICHKVRMHEGSQSSDKLTAFARALVIGRTRASHYLSKVPTLRTPLPKPGRLMIQDKAMAPAAVGAGEPRAGIIHATDHAPAPYPGAFFAWRCPRTRNGYARTPPFCSWSLNWL